MNSREMLDYEEFVGGFVPGLVAPGWLYSRKHPNYNALPPTSPASNPFAASRARYDFMRDSLANNNVDYYDLLFRRGVSQTHEINMNGGTQNSRYFVSLNYFQMDGTDRKSRIKRYTARFNLDNTVGKLNIQFNNSIGYSITDYNEGAFYAGNGTANPFAMAWRAKPYENPYDANGNLIFGPSTALVPRAMANLVDQCEAWGLVTREADPLDARARRVRFTATGLAWLQAFREAVAQAQAEFRAEVGDDVATVVSIGLEAYAGGAFGD
jgi:hypothetical protein